nr:reverse transcriptase domain-containing protein [Tanacetum cinerariifolium]
MLVDLIELESLLKIIMGNVIPPDHVDDLPVVKPYQHDDVPVVPEPVLVDEDEDPKEEEFEKKEPQAEEDDMEVDFEKDDNESELTYPYEEDTVKSEDETAPASVHEVGESSTAPFLRKDSDGLFPGLMKRDISSLFGMMASLSRRLRGRETAHALVKKKGKEIDDYYGKLILDLGNKVRSNVEEGTTAMENLVKNLSTAEEEKAECKKLKKELEEARSSNTLLCMQNERVKRDLYWTRARTHEFYREMIQSVDAAIAAERARYANAGNDARGSDQLGVKIPHLLMVEPKSVQIEAYIRGLSDNIKCEVTSSKPANLNEPNNQKQGNARAMTTTSTEGKVSSGSLPVFERFFTRHVMDAPTLPVSAEKNPGDPIDIKVDIVHPTPADVFPATTVVRILAQHGEAIRGIHGHLEGPLNFKGTKGIVGLSQWVEKMESVFHISGCAVKGNDVGGYTQRFQELALMCTKFISNETEKVDKYISGLLDNIYGNVMAARPKTLDDAIELANDLMDQKLPTYAERQAENKRILDNS